MAKKKDAAATATDTGELATERLAQIWHEYSNAIIAGLLLAVALTAFVLWKVNANEAREDEAWNQLADVKRRQHGLELDASLKRIATTYAGTSAAPFAKLTYATHLVDAGTKKDLEEARDVLTQLLTESGSNDLVRRVATAQLAGVKKELDDARTWKLMDAKKSAEPEKPSPSPSKEPK